MMVMVVLASHSSSSSVSGWLCKGNIPEDPDSRVGFDAGDQRKRSALWHGPIFQFVREKGHDVRADTAVNHQTTLATHRALRFK